MTSPRTEYETILKLVRTWPTAQRFTLVQDVLLTLAPQEQPSQPTLAQARGLLATDQPAPTDDQVAGWLAERRAARYDR